MTAPEMSRHMASSFFASRFSALPARLRALFPPARFPFPVLLFPIPLSLPLFPASAVPAFHALPCRNVCSLCAGSAYAETSAASAPEALTRKRLQPPRRKRLRGNVRSLRAGSAYASTSANSAPEAFARSCGASSIWEPILPPLTIMDGRSRALSSITVRYCFFMPTAVQPPRI